MRIWTLHPEYLDVKGLVAGWREGLLAQKVLRGLTTGYTKHPQLLRFRAQQDPVGAINQYLLHLFEEGERRGYHFDRNKIGSQSNIQIISTRGQLDYEWKHLKQKLQVRDPVRFQRLQTLRDPKSNPLFKIVPGEVESWEIIR